MSCFSSTPCVVSLAALSSVVLAQEATVVRKLNAVLDTVAAGDVRYAQLSPDGEWAVYFADLDADEVFDLFAVRTDGSGAPHELGSALEPFSGNLRVSPDSTRVVYRAGRDLAVIPIDGSAPAEPLTAVPAFAQVSSSFVITPDSSLVFYKADQEVNNLYELFAAPLDGSSPPYKLSQPHGLVDVVRVLLDPSGDAVLYTMTFGAGEHLFRVPLSGGTPVQLTTEGIYETLRISPDGSRAFYFDEVRAYYDWRLMTVPLDGSTAPSQIGVEDGTPDELEVSPDSSRVLYKFNDRTLYSAPADGSADPVVLTYVMEGEFRITADSARVAYLHSSRTLWSRVLDASQPEVRLDASDNVTDFEIVGTLVVYRGYADGGGDYQLFVVPPDGSAAPVRLDVGTGDVTSFTLAADGQFVAYTKNDELFLVPASGATPPVLIAARGAAPLFAPTRLVFDAVDDENANELFSVPLAGGTPTRLSLPFTIGETVIDVKRVHAQGRWAAYHVGDGTIDDELWCVRLDAPGSAFRVEGPAVHSGTALVAPFRVAFAESPERLVYHGRTDSKLYTVALGVSPVAEMLPGPAVSPPSTTSDDPSFLLDPTETYAIYRDTAGGLRRVPIDGSGPGDLLAPSCDFGFQLASGGQRVVYRAVATGRHRLFSVPIDASAPAVMLSPGTLDVGVSSEFHLGPDGAHVGFFAGGLYGAPTDGSAAAVLLNPTLNFVSDRDVTFDLTAGGTVVYLDGDPEDLYAVPVDGSASPIRLSRAPEGAYRIQQFGLTSDGERVVYVADHGPGALPRMLSAPVDGSAEPLNLSSVPPVSYGSFDLSPDGTRVLFEASLGRLFSARVDVAGSAVALYPTPPSGTSVSGFRFLDSRRVLFVSDGASPDQNELYMTSSSGGSMPWRLSAQLVAGGDVALSHLLPTEYGIAYLADADEDEVFELYLATPRKSAAVEPPR